MMKYEYTINKVLNPERITDPRVQLKEKKEINIKNLRNRKIKQRYRYDTDGHKTRVVETHERAVFLKSLGRKGKMLEIYESLLFHYYFTVRQPPSAYTRTRYVREQTLLRSLLRAFTRFKLSPSRAWTTAPIMAKDKSFSPHSHYRPRLDGASTFPISSSSTGTSGRRQRGFTS